MHARVATHDAEAFGEEEDEIHGERGCENEKNAPAC
jgi:hypothetical protein